MKGYRFLSFIKISIRKNISKTLNSKFSQKVDYPKLSATYVLKNTSEGVIQKAAEASGGLVGNKIVDKIKRTVSWSAPETAWQTDEKSVEIPKEKFISPEKR